MADLPLAELRQLLQGADTPWTLEEAAPGRTVIRSAPPEHNIVAQRVDPQAAPLIVAAVNQLPELVDRVDTRKVVDRAKGKLIEEHGMSENDAYVFLRRTAMDERTPLRGVAEQVIAGLVPGG